MAVFADRLFRFYHTQELAADPQIFLAGVVELFCNYPHEIVERSVSPVFGMPAKFKFPPRLSEIKEFLDEKMGPIRREQARPKALPKPEVDRSQRPTYDELKAKYGPNWGIGNANGA